MEFSSKIGYYENALGDSFRPKLGGCFFTFLFYQIKMVYKNGGKKPLNAVICQCC
jgi:hypothetical protein